MIEFLFTLIKTNCNNYDQLIANATIYYTFAQILYTLITALIFFVGWRQLSNLNRNLRINSLNTMIALENELNDRDERLNEIVSNFRSFHITNPNRFNLRLIRIYENDISTATQNYLNTLDRICFSIVNNFVSEDEWRPEYENLVIDAVRNNPEFFDHGSDFLNIVRLFNRWRS